MPQCEDWDTCHLKLLLIPKKSFFPGPACVCDELKILRGGSNAHLRRFGICSATWQLLGFGTKHIPYRALLLVLGRAEGAMVLQRGARGLRSSYELLKG